MTPKEAFIAAYLGPILTDNLGRVVDKSLGLWLGDRPAVLGGKQGGEGLSNSLLFWRQFGRRADGFSTHVVQSIACADRVCAQRKRLMKEGHFSWDFDECSAGKHSPCALITTPSP